MKLICEECDWKGLKADTLSAPNPFDDGEMMIGCPNCREPNSMVFACDEPDCWRQVSCGWPSPSGYRNTCFEHSKDNNPVLEQSQRP